MQIHGRRNKLLQSMKIYVNFTMVAPLQSHRFVCVLKQRRAQNKFTVVAPLHIHNKGNPKKNHAGGPLN